MLVGLGIDNDCFMHINKDEIYVQCKLMKGTMMTISCIPERLAKIDKILSIEGIDGWKVTEVYGKLSKKQLDDFYKKYKNSCTSLDKTNRIYK